jgi:hypothetical protein
VPSAQLGGGDELCHDSWIGNRGLIGGIEKLRNNGCYFDGKRNVAGRINNQSHQRHYRIGCGLNRAIIDMYGRSPIIKQINPGPQYLLKNLFVKQ